MRPTVFLAGVLATVLVTESLAQSDKSGGKPVVYTTFYPTTYFTQRVAGDLVEVVNPCPPDADPAFWVPDEATLAAYQKADLIVINGADFEKWVAKASLPRPRMVDTTRPLRGELITIKDAIRHSHGPSGEHTHEGIDGHTWLDPLNARVQAEQIRDALARLRPEHKAAFDKGFAELAADLDKLDARLKVLAPKLADVQLLANHPAWNYLARRYGWKVESYGVDPEETPDEKTLERMRAFVAKHPARLMLWEEEPKPEVAEKLKAALGVAHVVFEPGESLSKEQAEAGKNYLTIMNANIDRLEAALAK